MALTSAHTGVDQHKLRVIHEPAGNPVVVDTRGKLRVEASVSTQFPFAAVAIAPPSSAASTHGWVGIDVEPAGALTVPPEDFLFILGPTESQHYGQVAPGGGGGDLGRGPSPAALLGAWVRKEAVAKSLHTGFGPGGLDPAHIECGPPDSPRCTSHPWVDLTDISGQIDGRVYCAALAYNPKGNAQQTPKGHP